MNFESVNSVLEEQQSCAPCRPSRRCLGMGNQHESESASRLGWYLTAVWDICMAWWCQRRRGHQERAHTAIPTTRVGWHVLTRFPSTSLSHVAAWRRKFRHGMTTPLAVWHRLAWMYVRMIDISLCQGFDLRASRVGADAVWWCLAEFVDDHSHKSNSTTRLVSSLKNAKHGNRTLVDECLFLESLYSSRMLMLAFLILNCIRS